jgi:hypothetical protein
VFVSKFNKPTVDCADFYLTRIGMTLGAPVHGRNIWSLTANRPFAKGEFILEVAGDVVKREKI